MPDKVIVKGRYRRIKRAVFAAAGLFVAIMGVSYVRALRAPNSPGWDLRTAEWVRENHMGLALDLVEWGWFSVHKPSNDELEATELSAFPAPYARKRDDVKSSAEPTPIATVFDPMPGEGQWRAIGSTVNGVPTLRCTFYRPDIEHPKVSVAVARFTPELTRFVLVPGTRDPGGDWRWHGGIPQNQRENLLAAFNAGYRLDDAHGGLYVEGKVAKPLVVGAASLVVDKNGAPDIIGWTRRSKVTPEIDGVRQNLDLIVTDGKVLPDLRGSAMWRSGLGVASDGALIYLAGHGLTLGLLGKALQHVGAVRGMQLDIHEQWPSFNVFQPSTRRASRLVATKLLTNMSHPANRYLAPDDRDFVAVFVR